MATNKFMKMKQDQLKSSDEKKHEIVPGDMTKNYSFTIPERVREILTDLRIDNCPRITDSKYITNLIYEKHTGKPYYDERTGKRLNNK